MSEESQEFDTQISEKNKEVRERIREQNEIGGLE